MASKKKKTAKKSPKRKSAPKKRAAAKAPKVHQIVHWEIQSQNPETLHRFYEATLGWKINANNPMKYGLVASGGESGIDGGIGGTDGTTSRVLVYAAVPDIDAMLERITANGGKMVMPRSDLGMVVMAIYTDPEGNMMGLVES